MSLIPYHPLEGREIVLRHRNAIVVRDPDSHRLEIRGYAECPTCHQPLRPSTSEHSYERPYERSYETNPESYVNPSYFRMLRVGNGAITSNNASSSPERRLFKPALAGGSSDAEHSNNVGGDTEFESDMPDIAHPESSRIKRDAFTPNYFQTFFVEERVLGRGGKGVVLLVRHEIDGCHLGHFACKRVPIGDDHDWLEKVLIEVELLAKLSHPNLVSYRHVWLEDTRLTMFGPPVPCAFILQQYCNSGDLHQYVVGAVPREVTKEELKERMRRRSRGKLPDSPRDILGGKPRLSFEEIYSLFKDITSGVAYLHSANYVHRDLKPSNCLLHREGGKLHCLISDFGEVQPEHVVRKSTGSTGTISYCAPEVLRMDSDGNYANFTTKSDVFSLGMILYFMCFGRLPYEGANAIQEELEDIDQLRAEITDWKGFQDEKRERPDLPAKLYMLLKKLLALDPAQRPSANEVLGAMKNETSMDGMSRDRGLSPAKGFRGNRIQNLDSPAPPGTPVADVRKHHRSRSRELTQDEIGSWTGSTSSRQEIGGVGLANGSSSTQTYLDPSSAMVKNPGSRDGSRDFHYESPRVTPPNASEQIPMSMSPPLLLAPPESAASPKRAELALVRFQAALGVSQELVSYFGRLSLFLIKVASLVRPCWPYMASLEISVPLLILAALDLGFPAGTHSSRPGSSRRPSHGDAITGLLRSSGLGTRLLFLALHVSVIGMASRWQVLCANVSRNDWGDW